MSITFVGASSTRMTRRRSWLNDVMCISGRAGLAEITDAWDSIDGPGNGYLAV